MISLQRISIVVTAILQLACGLSLPSFDELIQHYPGYARRGGRYADSDLFGLIGHIPLKSGERHNDTSGLRMSMAFNAVGRQHRLGSTQIHISKYAADSLKGRDGSQYVYKTIAFGPFLAMKYQSPEMIRSFHFERDSILKLIKGRRGILRVVVYYPDSQRPDARVSLWDCDHSHHSRDWLSMHHMIGVEFWELASSSACPKT